MFDEINNQNPAKQTEDILAEVDRSVKPAVFQPKVASTPPTSYDDENKKLEATDSNKFFVLGAMVIGFILIIGVGYFGIKFYLNFRTSEKAVLNNNSSVSAPKPVAPALVPPADIITETPSALAPEPTSTEPVVVAPQTMVDSDQDGLTDEEEQQLGTDPNSIDSDNDGLFDREEVKVYGTNPLDADSDKDGYQDGEEVKNGYNPNGPGKLYEIK